MDKKWYTSKTLWVNALTVIATVIAKTTGFEIGGEEQLGILAVVNMILRAVTKTGLAA